MVRISEIPCAYSCELCIEKWRKLVAILYYTMQWFLIAMKTCQLLTNLCFVKNIICLNRLA